MKSIDEIRAISDPLERAVALAVLAREAEKKGKEARARRDMATVIAHFDHDVQPVVLYRDVLECSRGLVNRMIQRAPSDAERAKVVRENPGVFADPVEAAKSAAVDARKYEAIKKEAVGLRDRIATSLMRGVHPDTRARIKPVSNAEIARRTALTTARISQVRTGNNSRGKKSRVA